MSALVAVLWRRPSSAAAVIYLLLLLAATATAFLLAGAGVGYLAGSALPPLPTNAVPSTGPVDVAASVDGDGRIELFIDADGRLAAEGSTITEPAGTLTLTIVGSHEAPIRILVGTPDGSGSLELRYDLPFAPRTVGEGEITLPAGRYEIWSLPVAPGPESALTLLVTE
jgi:hypothetical protein